MDLVEKVVVITGGSVGLGAGMAEWFLSQGASVGVCARRLPKLGGERVFSRSVDVTDRDGLAQFASEVSRTLGPIDLWINNAAVLDPISPVRSMTYQQLEEHLRINLGGVLHGMQVFLAQLEADSHRGALVNISSGLARKGMAGAGAYSAAKAGVDRLTETVAFEESELLTYALAVSPGVIETDMQRTLRQQDVSVLHDVGMFRKLVEDDAMNSPEWVANVIAGWVFGDVDPEDVLVRVSSEPK
jgi:benzil reductase ((S)-benzoin forming)